MDIVAGARNKVSTYALRAAATIDEKLVSQARPRVKKVFGLRWLQSPAQSCPPLAPQKALSCRGAAGRPTARPAAIAIAG